MGLTETIATNILVDLAAALASFGEYLTGCAALLFFVVLHAPGEI